MYTICVPGTVTAFWRALTASWRQKGKRKQRSFLGPLARLSFAPDISEQPDPNVTELFDTRYHGSQRLPARYDHTRDVLVTRTHTHTTRDKGIKALTVPRRTLVRAAR